MSNKLKKAAVYYVIASFALTALWNVVLGVYLVPQYFFETEATVISVQDKRPATSGGGRQVNSFPAYEYVDDKGQKRIYESTDGFNRINGFLFKKEVGETYKAYYEKGSKEGLFITQTGDWLTFQLAPLVFTLPPLVFGVFIYFYRRKNTYQGVHGG